MVDEMRTRYGVVKGTTEKGDADGIMRRIRARISDDGNIME